MEKVVAVIVSLGLSVAFAAPTMAAATKTPTTKAACVKAKMSGTMPPRSTPSPICEVTLGSEHKEWPQDADLLGPFSI